MIILNDGNSGEIFILSGRKNTGKTQVCARIIERLKGKEIKITGVLSPGVYQNGGKSEIACVDVSTGQKSVLAEYSPGWDPENPNREWLFNPEALAWGNDVIARSVPTSLLVIDEIGFLELEKNAGWTNALIALDTGKFKHALVVIRPNLLEIALVRYPNAQIIQINPPQSQDEIVEYLVKHFS